MNKKIIIMIRKKSAFIILCLLSCAILTFILFETCGFKQSGLFKYPNEIVIIDPGHGGVDGGTSKLGLLEKDINLDISLKTKMYLEEKGYRVIMTRDKDMSLEEFCRRKISRYRRDLHTRVDMINNSNAKLFLSIHVNSNPKRPNTNGSIVFYNDKQPSSKHLALNIQRALNSIVINGKKRTVHDPRSASYFVLRNTNIPGVVVETAFISNQNELKLLKTSKFKRKLAKAIAKGVHRYFTKDRNVIITTKKH